MTEGILKQLAEEKGFLNVATMKPAHLIQNTSNCPVVEIPEEAILYVNSLGNLYFRIENKYTAFKEVKGNYKWEGMIYEKKSNQWAEIITSRRVSTNFPSEGVCWDPTQELRDFLSKKYDKNYSNYTSKGIAWGVSDFWPVEHSSGKTPYTMKQLERFIPKTIPEHLRQNPLRPEECYGGIKPGDKVIVDYPGNVTHGIEGIVEKLFNDNGMVKIEFKHPLPLHPEGGGLLAVPLIRVKHVLTHTETNDKPFSFTVINQNTNNLNLKKDGKSTEFRESRESNNYEKGESCKVQRPNLSIRGGSEIRATSIRCSKVKIQIRDGYSADSL